MIAEDRIFIPAMGGFLSCCLGIIIGGAFHSHCAYLGLLGKLDDKKAMDVVIRYFTVINKASVLFQGIGLIAATYEKAAQRDSYYCMRWLE